MKSHAVQDFVDTSPTMNTSLKRRSGTFRKKKKLKASPTMNSEYIRGVSIRRIDDDAKWSDLLEGDDKDICSFFNPEMFDKKSS